MEENCIHVEWKPEPSLDKSGKKRLVVATLFNSGLFVT